MAFLEHKLNLKVQQKQVLTPSLVQMVNLLALNKLELTDMIQQELVQNPVLEEGTEIVEGPELGTEPIIGFVVFAFLLGIGIVWLYAAIRPRFGAGVKTAIIAGVLAWLFAYAYPNFGMVFMGFFPIGLTTFTTVWGLAEVLIGAIAGAWVYTE